MGGVQGFGFGCVNFGVLLWRQAGVVERSLGQPSVQIQVGAGEP